MPGAAHPGGPHAYVGVRLVPLADVFKAQEAVYGHKTSGVKVGTVSIVTGRFDLLARVDGELNAIGHWVNEIRRAGVKGINGARPTIAAAGTGNPDPPAVAETETMSCINDMP